jgi:hypothetical protein
MLQEGVALPKLCIPFPVNHLNTLLATGFTNHDALRKQRMRATVSCLFRRHMFIKVKLNAMCTQKHTQANTYT